MHEVSNDEVTHLKLVCHIFKLKFEYKFILKKIKNVTVQIPRRRRDIVTENLSFGDQITSTPLCNSKLSPNTSCQLNIEKVY